MHTSFSKSSFTYWNFRLHAEYKPDRYMLEKQEFTFIRMYMFFSRMLASDETTKP